MLAKALNKVSSSGRNKTFSQFNWAENLNVLLEIIKNDEEEKKKKENDFP